MLTSINLIRKYDNVSISWRDKISDAKVYSIRENTKSEISIKIDGNDRIYIDGLRSAYNPAYEPWLSTDESENIYICGDKDISLYNENTNLNFIPGYYLVQLHHYSKIMYAWLHVESKFLKDSQYEQMISDIESMSEGLSKQDEIDYYGYAKKDDDMESISRINAILEKNYNEFMASCNFISKNINHEIKSTHQWSSRISSSLDNKSIKKMTEKNRNGFLYAKTNVANYSIPNNISLKKNLLVIRDKALQVNDAIQTKVSKIYISVINNLLYETWIKYITNDRLRDYKRYIGRNHNFREINKIKEELEDIKSEELFIERNFTNLKKSSSYLYEIWGFYRVVQSFYDLNFKPDNGIEFSELINNNVMSKLKNGLQEGISICMRKSVNKDDGEFSLKINIIYNKKISEEANSYPVYTTNSHDKPDIRIDFYDDTDGGIFLGCVVLDTKYRYKESFLVNEQRNGSFEQLQAYSNDINSYYMYVKEKSKIKGNRLKTVINVGVLYPLKSVTKGYVLKNEKRIQSLSTIALCPGKDYDDLVNFLDDSTNGIIRDYGNRI